MQLLRLLVLCLVTALLPFDGIARAAVPSCAAHRAASAPAAMHEHHADMAMMDMQMDAGADLHALHGAMHDAASAHDHGTAHDDCRCASLCAAHCASTTAAAALDPLAALASARNEAPAASDSRNPRPARRLDLLRPPATARA